jgi:hypothetical protein
MKPPCFCQLCRPNLEENEERQVEALSDSESKEHQEIARARRQGYEGPDSILGVAMWREELREATERASHIAAFVGAFARPEKEQQ